MARVLPDLFGGERVRRVSGYPARLLAALRAAAPAGVDDPMVVLLTPGAYNSAYFEHSLLARQMGVELVEGRDLVSRNGVVFLRTTEGEQRVDVVYRRIDDDYPRPGALPAGLGHRLPRHPRRRACGNIAIANAVGNGVADDKLAYTYVPTMVDYYLGETPLLRNVDTYRLEEPDARAHVLDNLEKLVLKPVDGSGGYGLVIGPSATERQLAKLRKDVLADPRRWIAQPVVPLSTAPTLVDGELVPRHLDLRPFAVNDGNRVWVMHGGLTRVALVEGSLVVNSSQGGGSKDTWVLSGATEPRRDPRRPRPHGSAGGPLHVGVPDAGTPHRPGPATATTAARDAAVLSRIAESLFWIGRLVERAEDVSRMLDVSVNLLLEESSASDVEACRTLLSVVGVSERVERPAFDAETGPRPAGL